MIEELLTEETGFQVHGLGSWVSNEREVIDERNRLQVTPYA